MTGNGVCPLHKEPLDPVTGRCALCEILGSEGMEEAERAQSEAEAEPEAVKVIVPLHSPDEEPPPPPQEETPEEVLSEEEQRERSEENAFFDELAEIKKDGHFAILFFGVQTAGKTWLLHRMKEQLMEQGIPCDPQFHHVKGPRGQRVDLEGTTKIEFHYVLADQTFVLIDIPGERTEFLVDAQYGKLRMLLAAMDYAKAIIITLPADVMFFGQLLPTDNEAIMRAARQSVDDPAPAPPPPPPQTRGRRKKRPAAAAAAGPDRRAVIAWADGLRDDNDRMDQFTRGVFRVAGLLSYLRRNKIDPADKKAFETKVTYEQVRRHMGRREECTPVGGRDGLDCPTFFALTKADRVLSLMFDSTDALVGLRNAEIRVRPESHVFGSLVKAAGLERALLRDPWLAVRKVRNVLHGQLLSVFPMSKFDYTTAFYGHDGSVTLTRDHYARHPPHGVVEVLEWISDARRLGRRRRLLRMPYAWASAAQRFVEKVRVHQRLDFGKKEAGE